MKFMDKYDSGHIWWADSNETATSALEKEIINSNFREEEISEAINFLKNGKSPGVDGIPAEFIKHCRDVLCAPITMVLNYIIEERNFP